MKLGNKKNLSVLLWLCLTLNSYAENKVTQLNFSLADELISISPELEFTTTNEVKKAIDNGIRVQLIVKAQLYEPNNWWFDRTIKSDYIQLEVSYYVLGKYYMISNKKNNEHIGNAEYSKLWQQLNQLIEIKLPNDPTDNLWARLRIVLDKGALPTAMQLPVLFDENWDIGTDWYAQPVKIGKTE